MFQSVFDYYKERASARSLDMCKWQQLYTAAVAVV